MTEQHEVWMDAALALARAAVDSGNVPVASVIVKDGAKIGEGGNLATTRRDPILHAEIVAIQDACRRLGSADLAGATLYTTMEPCPMCAWAIVAAGIKRVVLGARHADLNRTDMGTYRFEALMSLGGQSVELVTGVRHADAVTLRRAWSQKTGRPA
ncbi:MAG TPA: nucleoside deaminase [Candidatus Sulfotelmatobacter sp.]|nr:nucleoside deaminase [Candidatus Sulfotelmatobacter sp.]